MSSSRRALRLLAAVTLVAAAVAAPATPAAAQPTLSSRVHLFYYPWYGSPLVHGNFRHWQQGGHTPPSDIGADLYPVRGHTTRATSPPRCPITCAGFRSPAPA